MDLCVAGRMDGGCALKLFWCCLLCVFFVFVFCFLFFCCHALRTRQLENPVDDLQGTVPVLLLEICILNVRAAGPPRVAYSTRLPPPKQSETTVSCQGLVLWAVQFTNPALRCDAGGKRRFFGCAGLRFCRMEAARHRLFFIVLRMI